MVRVFLLLPLFCPHFWLCARAVLACIYPLLFFFHQFSAKLYLCMAFMRKLSGQVVFEYGEYDALRSFLNMPVSQALKASSPCMAFVTCTTGSVASHFCAAVILCFHLQSCRKFVLGQTVVLGSRAGSHGDYEQPPFR